MADYIICPHCGFRVPRGMIRKGTCGACRFGEPYSGSMELKFRSYVKCVNPEILKRHKGEGGYVMKQRCQPKCRNYEQAEEEVEIAHVEYTAEQCGREK